MDKAHSGSCSMEGFGVRGVAYSDSITIQLAHPNFQIIQCYTPSSKHSTGST